MSGKLLDLKAYFRRIGYLGEVAATLPVLDALHWHHASTIPFENLDIQLGRPVSLDLAAIERKLVTGQRGGYCFEQNRLFLAALSTLGYRASALAARVWWGRKDTQLPPRTHMLVHVELEDGAHIADVGFGSLTLPRPLKLQADIEQPTTHETYRLIPFGAEMALQARLEDGWTTLYSFALRTEEPEDFDLANWFVATHPDSIFVQSMIAVRPFTGGRHILQAAKSTIRALDRSEQIRQLTSAADLQGVLAEKFGLRLTEAETRTLWARLPAGAGG